jgi:hypothetical protein
MIKIVKLISGDELICDFEVVNDQAVLKNPFRFLMTQEGLASIPLMPFSKDKEYKISMNHVLFVAEPEEDFRNSYNSQHGNGIVIPKNNMVITD